MRKTESYYLTEEEYGLVPSYKWSELAETEKSVIKNAKMGVLDVKYMPTGKISLDISSGEGVGFYLIGYAKKLAPQLGMNTNKIIAEMSEDDEENLIKVFDNHFGEVVDLYR